MRACPPRLVWTFTLAWTLASPLAAGAAVYYVDNTSSSCSNSGPGTEAQPYCTITAARTAHHGPGVTIVVKPGVYREQVNANDSGVSGNPFVFQAAPGGPVVVDGSDDFSSTSLWVPYSGDVYRASSVTWNPVQVFAEGERLTRVVVAPTELEEDEFTWVMGEGLYVNLAGDNPGEHQLWVGRRSNGFQVAGRSWVTITGFHVRHTESRGILLNTGSADCLISRDTVTFTGSYGIQSNNGQRHTIEYCSTSDNLLHGIGLGSGTTACTIRYNEAMRNEDPLIRRANGFYLNEATANTFYGNRAYDNQDSGFNFGDFAANNVCYNNLSWNNGDHGYDHLDAAGTIHFHDIAFGNYKDGFSIEGFSPNTQLFNCIAVDNGLTTNEFDLWVNDTSTAGFVSDYNIFWNSTSQEPIKYINTKYATIADYQAASGQDLHSTQANPLFVNAPLGDFRLLPGSPAIDAATSAVPGWPPADMLGMPRMDDPATANTGAGPIPFADRGAIEFEPADRPPEVSAPDTAAVPEGTPLAVPITASDPDGDPILSLTALELPAGAVFAPDPGDSSGTLAWTPDFTQAGSHTVRFVAANALADTDTTVIVVIPVDRPPIVAAPDTVFGAEGVLLSVPVTASDPDGDPIASLTALDPPPGAAFAPGPGDSSGTLTWVPPFGSAGSLTVRFVAANALADTDTTVIQITDVDRPPGLSAPDSATVAENGMLELTVTAADPDGQPIDSLTVSGLPSGASFVVATDHLSGTLAWMPGFTQAGSYTVVFAAANALADSDTTVITVHNTDRPPLVTVAEAVSVLATDSVVVVVAASDPDGEPIDSLTVSGLPDGATFTVDPGDSSGTLRWTPTPEQAGVHTVSFTATHVLSGTDSTVITVNLSVAGVRTGPAVGRPLEPRLAPNPVRSLAHLRFSIAHDGPLGVRVFDVGGRAVRTLLDDPSALAGEYDVSLDVGGGRDAPLRQGLYFYRIETRHGTARGRFLVVR